MTVLTRREFLLGITCIGIACSRPKRKTVRLPSGAEIALIATGKMYFSKEKKWGLTLKYETAIPLSDLGSTRAQAREVLDAFRAEVEKGDVTVVVLSAQSPPTGVFLRRATMANVIFERTATGEWRIR
jgi:hypothetical protein